MAYLEGKGVELQKHDLAQELRRASFSSGWSMSRIWKTFSTRAVLVLRHAEHAVFGFDADKYDRLTKP